MIALKKPMILAVAGAMALTACTSTSGNQTEIGAATGAVLGGLFGASRDGDNNALKTAAGAAVGAAIGGAIGQQLERQKAELDQSFASNEIDVINTGSELIVRMPNAILFDVDSASLRGDLRSDLNVLAGNLLRYPDSTVFVTGHTDNTGAASYNQDLSERRASSAAEYLGGQGIVSSRLTTRGMGESEPVATNETAEGRQENRRVEVAIYASEEYRERAKERAGNQ